MNEPQTIVKSFGRFVRRENGLIYFYKADGITLNGHTAIQLLKTVRELDNTGQARIIIIMGSCAGCSSEAQNLFLANRVLGGLAYVTQATDWSPLSEHSLQLTHSLVFKHPMGAFNHVRDAEAWFLNSETGSQPIPNLTAPPDACAPSSG